MSSRSGRRRSSRASCWRGGSSGAPRAARRPTARPDAARRRRHRHLPRLCRHPVRRRLRRRPPGAPRPRAAGSPRRWSTRSSISVYCTSWTFYRRRRLGGAQRARVRRPSISARPSSSSAGGSFLRKLVTRRPHPPHHLDRRPHLLPLRQVEPRSAALVTVIALIATAPYIALQLKAVTSSSRSSLLRAAPWRRRASARARLRRSPSGVAAGLALFSILFGMRNIDVNERHHGVIAAIALRGGGEARGAARGRRLGVVFAGGGARGGLRRRAPRASTSTPPATFGARWITMHMLAGAAVICLPRQFQITVVENSSESQLRTARWLFPLYLLLISLFVVPIALAGLQPPARRVRPRHLRADAAARAPARTRWRSSPSSAASRRPPR